MDLFGNEAPEEYAQAEIDMRDYHTPNMVARLAQLKEAMLIARARHGRSSPRALQATKDYYQLRDYLEKMSHGEWAAEIGVRNRRGRR